MPFYKNRFNDFPFCQVWKGRQLLIVKKVKDFFLSKSHNPGWNHIEQLRILSLLPPASFPVARFLSWVTPRSAVAELTSWWSCLLVIKCLHWVSLLTSDGSHRAREFSLIIYKITFCPLTSLSSVVCQRKLSSDLKWECCDCQQFLKYIEREK